MAAIDTVIGLLLSVVFLSWVVLSEYSVSICHSYALSLKSDFMQFLHDF